MEKDLDTVDNFKDLYFPGVKEGIYKINPYGDIWSKKLQGLMKPQIDKDGYLRIKLSGGDKNHTTSISIAKLVMYNYGTLPPNNMKDPTINHIDGNIKNNHYSNLEWLERGINSSIRKNKGQNELNHEAILTESQVEEICNLLLTTELPLADIGNIYNVEKSTIYNIYKQKTWKSITTKYEFNCRSSIRGPDGRFKTYNSNCHSTGVK